MDLREIGCEYEKWMEPAQCRVLRWTLVLAVLKFRRLILDNWLKTKSHFRTVKDIWGLG